ncbi:MAG: YceI family protein [Deltaproteobacteria bacterium]|nr:YceI family protein [Deltaproteobacteria bacterium]
MPKFDATTARCLVFTFKEGLLSPVAHDLKLRVERFEIDIEPASPGAAPRLTARFESRSLRVVCAMKNGRDAPDSLSAKDCTDIEKNIVEAVLDVRKHPHILFESTSIEPAGGGYLIRGRLGIQGRERVIRLDARKQGDRLVAEARLHQPDFGIKPFSAMLGTIRIKADVDVRVELPASAAAL